ncbi:MAG TPA: YetF domain-containing protein [Solirubrobacteraceae bacterium]|nr:YetF domain-containing protein [Solirubrobacteraceae bacterium]
MDLVIRAAVVFFFILLITRMIGRRELSSLEPFDLIMLVVIGDLVQQGVTQSDYSITGALIVISTIAVLTALMAFVNFRFRPLRRVLEGQPVVLVENGRVVERNMRRERLTREELEAEGRQQQVPSVADMRWAVLETSGQISVIPKQG